jgi:nitrate reductase delta subunit
MILLFKAFSALLSYPAAEMRQALPEIADVIRTSHLVASREQAALLALIEEIGSDDLLSAQEHYVDLFDRGRALSLHLFEHLHGESRDRGSAMVQLKELYAAAGFDLATRELPDYLPVVLEYLSCREMAEVREILTDCADILKTIAKALIARRSRYAAVLQALIVIAGEKPVDAATVPPARERNEALDRDWIEQPAFADPAGRR